MILNCISLWQPWATWVSEGFKLIETRTHDRFRCLLGERIAIQAAMRWDDLAFAMSSPWATNDARLLALRQRDQYRGVILCTALVEAVGWLNESNSASAMIHCGGVTARFGLFLSDIEPLKNPIPWKGRQGIFKVEIPDTML